MRRTSTGASDPHTSSSLCIRHLPKIQLLFCLTEAYFTINMHLAAMSGLQRGAAQRGGGCLAVLAIRMEKRMSHIEVVPRRQESAVVVVVVVALSVSTWAENTTVTF